MNYINIAGYKFIELNDLHSLQNTLIPICESLQLKGTILLGHEGINIVASGTRIHIDAFKGAIQSHIPDILFKESPSASQPFKHMRIKIKPEIVTFGVPEINPLQSPAPYVTPEDFQAWFDANKDMVILDTRNDYEVEMGKFKNALHLSIDHFKQFPEAAKTLPEDLKSKTIVTYCTGGIRCEKAAPYLMQLGFTSVYQLEGGILSYLEKFPDTHFEGSCFVFDNRVGVESDLHPLVQKVNEGL